MSQEYLDAFGKILIKEVRDRSIRHWRSIIDGRMKAEEDRHLHETIQQNMDVQTLLSLVPRIVDTVLHYTLSMIEDEIELSVSIDVQKEGIKNVRDISDGLAGELYTTDGWISRFSEYYNQSDKTA